MAEYEPPLESPVIFRLWVALSQARFQSARIGERGISLEKLAVKAWESTDPAVVAAWERLTHPDNLRGLEAWSEQVWNPIAAEATRKALEICRSRSVSGELPSIGTIEPH